MKTFVLIIALFTLIQGRPDAGYSYSGLDSRAMLPGNYRTPRMSRSGVRGFGGSPNTGQHGYQKVIRIIRHGEHGGRISGGYGGGFGEVRGFNSDIHGGYGGGHSFQSGVSGGYAGDVNGGYSGGHSFQGSVSGGYGGDVNGGYSSGFGGDIGGFGGAHEGYSSGFGGGNEGYNSGSDGGLSTIQKHIYVHMPPPEPLDHHPKKPTYVPPPQKHYKIIFIKAPSPPAPTIPDIPVQPQNEEKTFIYVLVKKPEDPPEIVLPTPAPTIPSKPEVYFIRYKAPKKNVGSGGSIEDGVGGGHSENDNYGGTGYGSNDPSISNGNYGLPDPNSSYGPPDPNSGYESQYSSGGYGSPNQNSGYGLREQNGGYRSEYSRSNYGSPGPSGAYYHGI